MLTRIYSEVRRKGARAAAGILLTTLSSHAIAGSFVQIEASKTTQYHDWTQVQSSISNYIDDSIKFKCTVVDAEGKENEITKEIGAATVLWLHPGNSYARNYNHGMCDGSTYYGMAGGNEKNAPSATLWIETINNTLPGHTFLASGWSVKFELTVDGVTTVQTNTGPGGELDYVAVQVAKAIDFGTLHASNSATRDMILLGSKDGEKINKSGVITISDQNSGNLVNKDAESSRIPWTLTIPDNCQSTSNVSEGHGTIVLNSADNDSCAVGLTVNVPRSVAAGSYTDTITATLNYQ